MKKLVALLILSALTVTVLASCSENKTSQKEETPFEGGSVLILSPNSDDETAAELETELQKYGADVLRQSYSDLKKDALITSADAIIDTSRRSYYPPRVSELASYVKNGGNYLAISSHPLSEKTYLSNGRYVSESEIIENGNLLFAPETEEDILGLDRVSDTISTLPDVDAVADFGSGYGNSLEVTVGMFRSKNTFSMPVTVGDGNALLVRYKPICKAGTGIVLMFTLDDGSIYYTSFSHEDISNGWRTAVVSESDFIPYSENESGTFSFDRAVSMTFGLDEKVSNTKNALHITYCIDCIAVFDAESLYDTDSYEFYNELFPTSYYENYSVSEISEINPGRDAAKISDYNMSFESATSYVFDGQNLSLPEIKSGFTFIHNGIDPNGTVKRIESLVSTDVGDLVWIADRTFGGRVAVIGTSDEEFMRAAGYSLAIETVRRMLSPSAVTESPDDGCYCTDTGDRILKYGFKSDTAATLSVEAIADNGASILKEKFDSSSLSSTDGNRYHAEITLTPEDFDGKDIKSVTVTALLSSGGRVTDVASSTLEIITERKTVTVACVGDSLTEACGLDISLSYPDRLESVDGEYKIIGENYGRGGASIYKNAEYHGTEKHLLSLETKADYVFIVFGANDVYNWNDEGRDTFTDRYKMLIEQYQALEQHPKVVLGITIPRYDTDCNVFYNGVEKDTGIKDKVISLGHELNLPIIDLSDCLPGDPNCLYEDTVHPNATGYYIMCRAVYCGLSEIIKSNEAS